MRAAVTDGVGSMAVLDRAEPAPPGEGEVVIRPEAVGICGSDYHFFTGELSAAAGGSQFPRIQGHELAGTITAAGPGCRAELGIGQRVAVWPLHPCGQCYPCGAGRPNACDRLTLTGIHLDGGLQERLASVAPGLRIAGGGYDGVGIPDCVRQGQEAARALVGRSAGSQSAVSGQSVGGQSGGDLGSRSGL